MMNKIEKGKFFLEEEEEKKGDEVNEPLRRLRWE